MFTYQVRPRSFKIDSPLSFPAEVEINFHLQPKQPFGASADGGRTAVFGKAATMLFNLNSGAHTVKSKFPLDPLEVRIEDKSRVVEQNGNVLTITQRFDHLNDVQDFVTSLYFGFPILLNLAFADPPHVERVDGKIGDVPFRWELSEWKFRIKTTTQLKQEQCIVDSWSRLDVISNPKNRRLIGALHYFHIACRLDRSSEQPAEFLGEVILNLAKTLECVFPPSGEEESADAARCWLKKLGYSTNEIERDFIPAIYLRSNIDVAHVQLRVYTVEQLKTVHTYVENAEQKFQEMLSRLLEKIESGEITLDPYEFGDKNDNADKVIRHIEENLQKS